MNVREKLVELLEPHMSGLACEYESGSCELTSCRSCNARNIADHLISNGVTVQEHGYWETVVEVRDNTVCGNGVKIEYKRCSCCKNPAKNFENDFCGNCGAKLDLPQPPKGE